MATRNIAIIGAGILGVTVARELLRRYDDVKITVYEKEAEPGLHQTGHNSGVVHAGIYYPPGSLKAQLATKGSRLMVEYCQEHGLRYEECGKLIVAKNDEEIARMQNIYDRGMQNKVRGLKLVDADAIAELEPHVNGVAAIHSPKTAIVDFKEIAQHMSRECHKAGVNFFLNTRVDSIVQRGNQAIIKTSKGSQAHDVVIACAGLQSDRLARKSEGESDPRIVPFYGEYYQLAPAKTHLVKGLVYPVPDPQYPFLGVHITRTIDGRVTIGPNAFLSLARERYGRFSINVADVATTLTTKGFWHFAWANRKNALREFSSAMSKKTFVQGTQDFLPEVTNDDVLTYRRGIRAQAITSKGTLEDDFVIQHSDNIVHVRNAPSPAATSSIAIAEYIVDRLEL